MDRGVIAAASELFESKHYAEAAAICAQGLQHEPRCLPLLLLSARSFVALRREADARADLRDILRFAPECGMAFRLLGELAARREENETAAIFFREALRLDPSDREAADWLAIVTPSARPAAAALQLPAPAAAAGRFSRVTRLARGTEQDADEPTHAIERPFSRGSEPPGNTWSGTVPSLPPAPNEVVPGTSTAAPDAPTLVTAPIVVAPVPAIPIGRVSKHLLPAERGSRAAIARPMVTSDRESRSITEGATAPRPIRVLAAPAPAFRDPPSVSERPTSARSMRIVAAPPIADLPAVPQTGGPQRSRPSQSAAARPSARDGALAAAPDHAAPARPSMSPSAPAPALKVATPSRFSASVGRAVDPMPRMSSAALPELPGFAEFLVTSGLITRDRLRAAQAYQRSMKVQLATAIVTLGLASAERVEWAVVAHQSQLARGG